MNEPDWDAGTENAYEVHRQKHSSGLCVNCGEDAAVPDDPDNLCRFCLTEAERKLARLEVDRDPGDETGYDSDDPKHPTFHDRYADVWDMREKAA
jgi:hypothetical protein